MPEYYYNSQQPPIILKEYGRNIQKLVEYIKTIEDHTLRTRYAQTLVSLMKQLTPDTKNNVEYQSKYWDDMFIMAHFDLEIDSPYPMPEKSALGKKPKQVAYGNNKIMYRHYGRNVEILIEQALAEQDMELCYQAFYYILQLMRTFYTSWNKDNIDDQTLINHLKIISQNRVPKAIIDRLLAPEENLNKIPQRTQPKNPNNNHQADNNKAKNHKNTQHHRFHNHKNKKKKRP